MAKRYRLMSLYYSQYKEFFKKNIENLLAKFKVELVIYDEAEYFRQHNDPQFYYPYAPRKIKNTEYRFSVPDY